MTALRHKFNLSDWVIEILNFSPRNEKQTKTGGGIRNKYYVYDKMLLVFIILNNTSIGSCAYRSNCMTPERIM